MARKPLKRPKEPPKPLMKFARPAMKKMILRVEKMLVVEDDTSISDFLQRSRAWPTNARYKTKEEVAEIKKLAGSLVMEFNREHSHRDSGGFIIFAPPTS